MTTSPQKEIRELLERAVAPIDPVAPPLDVIRERAVKLRRFRISAGGGLLAAAAAAVTVAVVVVPASGSQSIRVAAPSAASLTSYASAQGGKHVAGPILDGNHYVGAFATKKTIVIVKYGSGAWHADGQPITKFGGGHLVRKIADAGAIVPGTASFVVHTLGGDVSYFGGVLYDANGTWTVARFAKCPGHKNLSCAFAGDEQPYGHVAAGAFRSVHNNCEPNCAAGTNYSITWHWNASQKRFATRASDIVKYKVYKVPSKS